MIWLLGLIIISQMICSAFLRFSMDLVSPFFELKIYGLFFVIFLCWAFSGNKEKKIF
tara:strand:+ start:2086 stop:2256 length:171 start_codon:yes stop_codon:yes gene_type:complete